MLQPFMYLFFLLSLLSLSLQTAAEKRSTINPPTQLSELGKINSYTNYINIQRWETSTRISPSTHLADNLYTNNKNKKPKRSTINPATQVSEVDKINLYPNYKNIKSWEFSTAGDFVAFLDSNYGVIFVNLPSASYFSSFHPPSPSLDIGGLFSDPISGTSSLIPLSLSFGIFYIFGVLCLFPFS
jgi:hypothetical protein